jgi:phage-related protein
MAELITKAGRKAIKKMAQISQCARVLSLMPTAEDFAMRLVGDLRHIAGTVNNISTRINEILDKYSSIPTEFLLKGFDVVLEKLDDISDYAKFAINETLDMAADTVKNAREITRAVGDTASMVTSTIMQVGGGIAYGGLQIATDAFE